MNFPSERHEIWVVRLLQAGLAAIAGYGLVRGETGIVVNGGLGLAVTFVPALLRRDAGVALPTGYVVWIALAVFLHAVGVLGPYRQYPWYDAVTHGLSASIVAGVGYATVVAIDRNSEQTTLGSELRFVFVLIFVLALGVSWEILEFAVGLVGGKSVLVQYGLDDAINDLVFNTVGGLVVAAWDTPRPQEAADTLSETVEENS